jgi:hypothetical protein
MIRSWVGFEKPGGSESISYLDPTRASLVLGPESIAKHKRKGWEYKS